MFRSCRCYSDTGAALAARALSLGSVTIQSSYQDLLVDVDCGVAEITINRPERLNALSHRVREELKAVLTELESRDDTGAVVITGMGDRAFAAGQDLAEAQLFTAESAAGWVDHWREVFDAVLRFPKPTVAAVNGYAVGAGFQLALVCDLRVASERARFGMPEIDDGIPCITGTWTLYELIGRGRSLDLVLTGRMLSAAEALDWGIVSRVVSHEKVRAAARSLAETLAAKPGTAMRLNKSWYRQLLLERLTPAEHYAKRAHTEAFASGEPQVKMAEFLTKRATGRGT